MEGYPRGNDKSRSRGQHLQKCRCIRRKSQAERYGMTFKRKGHMDVTDYDIFGPYSAKDNITERCRV